MSKIALITGGAQGIGAAAAKQLLQTEFDGVVLLGRTKAKLEKAAAELSSFGKVEILASDLTDAVTPAKAIALTKAKFGRLDLLLNAAGNTARYGIMDATPAAFHDVFNTNVLAPMMMMQEAAKMMLPQKSGTMINISSMLAHGGPPPLAIYAASKGALVSLTRNVANTFKRDGIRVFAINLGWVNSEGEHELQTKFHKMPENWADKIGARMPSGRLQVASDVAGLIHYLTTPSAQMMTGAIIDYEQMPTGVYDEHPALGPA